MSKTRMQIRGRTVLGVKLDYLTLSGICTVEYTVEYSAIKLLPDHSPEKHP